MGHEQFQNALMHYGILGMRWGVRRERKAAERAERKDLKWVRSKGEKITSRIKGPSAQEAAAYAKQVTGDKSRTSTGKISKTFMNEYNRKLAELMNERVSNIQAPSGKVIRYIAKRGELGVHTALADAGYDMNQVRNGVNAAGRIAYRQEILKKG